MLLMLIGAIDVIARYLLNYPIKGALGLSEILLVGIVFLAWPYTQFVNGNVKVEIFYSRFRPRVQSIVGAVKTLLALCVFGIMAYQSFNKVLESRESMEIIDVLNIPAYPFHLFVTVGVVALCLQLIVDFMNFLDRDRGG